jgi:hypothetical protein
MRLEETTAMSSTTLRDVEGPIDETILVEQFRDALNARDLDALAECFDLPVTAMRGPSGDGTDFGEVAAIADLGAMLNLLPDYWERSTLDSVVTLASAAPFPTPIPDGKYRPGVVATWTRWDRDGPPFERIQGLYLMTRRDGRLRIKFAAELILAKID